VEHLAQRHRIEVDGEVERVPRETVFELIFALDVPTQVPRLGVTFEVILIPFGDTAVHPFTGAPASAGGQRSIRDNGIELESELNFFLFDTKQTAGWVSSHVDLVDKFSPGDTPRAGSVYTHKLNFEWDTAFHVFNRVQQAPWLRNVEVEVSLDSDTVHRLSHAGYRQYRWDCWRLRPHDQNASIRQCAGGRGERVLGEPLEITRL
jgi:hypothetical protein